MKETLRQRLDSFSDRFEELAMLLSDPEVINNQQRFRDYSREYSELEELVAAWKRYLEVENSIAEAEQLSRDSDPEMRE
ncbi:MAG TPA: peptide chain release factor 1, partial [Halomonas sp.]|nr:peptide chain release factor 1 [Halomonas sp.]